MNVTPDQARGALMFACGVLFVAAAAFAAWRDIPKLTASPLALSLPAALLILTAASFALRIDRLSTDTLAHPEIYVPNIPLPANISEPPPRHTLRDTLAWHFHDEPHPAGYYLIAGLWTAIFGTSEFVLRLPSAILGALSIPFIYLAATRILPVRAAWIAAALLAFNGHHIFWSRLARMYAMVCLLGLAATWLLFVILRQGPTRARLAAYFAVSWLGLFTDILYWPLLFAHVIVCLLHAGRVRNLLFRVQMMIVMLGTHVAAHAVYRARPSPIYEPTWEFLRDFLSFGFSFRNDAWRSPENGWPRWMLEALLVFALVLIACGIRRVPAPCRDTSAVYPTRRSLLLMMLGAVLIDLAFSYIAFQRNLLMATVSLLAVAAFAAACLIHRVPYPRAGRALPDPLVIVGLLPPLMVYAASFFASLTAGRLFLVFVPGLLMLLAAGIHRLARSRPIAIGLAVAVIGVTAASVVHFRSQSASPRDYKQLGLAIKRHLDPADLILVQKKSWATTPLFYYLASHSHQLVAADHDSAAARAQRVWLVEMEYEPPTAPMAAAVAGRRATTTFTFRGCRATLFEK